MKNQRLITFFLVLAVIVAAFSLRQEWGGKTPQPSDAVLAQPIALWSSTPSTSAAENAARHWQKHGREFPEYSGEVAYVAGAHDFVSHPPPSAQIKHRSNGDTLFYDPVTNTFAVADRHGAPRTYFRPSNGLAYWRRQ